MGSERKRGFFSIALLLLPLALASTYIGLPDERDVEASTIPFTLDVDDAFTQIATLSVEAQVPSEDLACVRWEIDNGESREAICRGGEACCGFLGRPVDHPDWDEPLYLYLGAYGAGKRNTVTAQVVYADINLEDLDDLRADIRYSDVKSIDVYLLESAAPVGNIVAIDDPLSSIYVELGSEDELDGDLKPRFTPAVQQDRIRIGIPVEFYQTLTIQNAGSGTEDFTFNLWRYGDEVGRSILQDLVGIRVFRDGALLSETPVFLDSLAASETADYTLIYDLPPVHLEKECEDLTVQNLLPPGATILSSEIEGAVGTRCTLTVWHDSVTHYHDIAVGFDDMDAGDITSVYYVEGDRYLTLNDGTIRVPSLN